MQFLCVARAPCMAEAIELSCPCRPTQSVEPCMFGLYSSPSRTQTCMHSVGTCVWLLALISGSVYVARHAVHDPAHPMINRAEPATIPASAARVLYVWQECPLQVAAKVPISPDTRIYSNASVLSCTVLLSAACVGWSVLYTRG